MLAQARDALPRPGPGGAAAEVKFDPGASEMNTWARASRWCRLVTA